MKKLLLINPVGQKSGYMRSPFSLWPPLGLAYVAGATPPDWQVRILDENFEPFAFEEADLVGITAFSSRIKRAYDIANVYRERNVRVVLGGIHASMASDEAAMHADAVVIGEAEGVWGKVIDDFEHDRLSSKYEGPKVDLSKPGVRPRRDLVRHSYFWESVQTSRGCPFNCDFCSVSRYLGKEYRKREVDDVLEELKTLKGHWLMFVDDNLIGYTEEHKSVAAKLFSGMIENKLNKKFWMQTSINIIEDEHLIKLAAKAGCMFAFVGFEAVSEETLKGMKKGINLKIGVRRYEQVVKMFHKYGIAIMGGFITGNANEPTSYYKQLADFMLGAGVDICQVSILTPFPGTALMDRITKEDRLLCRNFPEEWSKFTFSHLVHQPEGTSVEAVYRGHNYVKTKLYHFPHYQYRLLKSLYHVKGLDRFYSVYRMNQVLREAWLKSHYYQRIGRLT